MKFETKIGKMFMEYDNSPTIKEHFYKKYECTDGWNHLKPIVGNLV